MTNEKALLLTQYEVTGLVGMKEYIDYFIDEELEISIDDLTDYNDYLFDEGYEIYYSFDEIEYLLEGKSALEILEMGRYSNISYNDDFVTFDGYGNLESESEYSLIGQMEGDRDFLKWLVTKNESIDEDEAMEVISKANELIKKGY